MEQDTQAIAELWQGSDVARLVGKQATLTNTLTGATITGEIHEAITRTLSSESPLFVEGMTYVTSVKVKGIFDSLDLATPFRSDYERKNYNLWLINLQA